MTELLCSDDARTLFVQGCVQNHVKFYDRFDAVVLLSAPVEVMLGWLRESYHQMGMQERLAGR